MSNLNHIGFQKIQPSPALRPFVQSYWVVQANTSRTEEFWHPDGGTGIVFNFGDDFTLDEHPLPDRIFLNGISPISKRLGLGGHIHALGIRFNPGGASSFFTHPLYELTDTITHLHSNDKDFLRLMYDDIEQLSTLREKILKIEGWLKKIYQPQQENTLLTQASLKMIASRKGVLSIASLAREMFISQRQLERLFKKQVGISPKTYARLQQVRQARKVLKANTGLLADVGYQTGFYDQSHFIREFKKVVGITPTQYVIKKCD